MIWRRAHPVRGLVTAVVVMLALVLLGGSGVGVLELAVIAVVGVATFWFASGGRKAVAAPA